MEKAEEKGIQVYFPDKMLCTDNAAMIATAGYYDYINGKTRWTWFESLSSI